MYLCNQNVSNLKDVCLNFCSGRNDTFATKRIMREGITLYEKCSRKLLNFVRDYLLRIIERRKTIKKNPTRYLFIKPLGNVINGNKKK